MNGVKVKILVFCLSLLFGGLCLGLCFLDSHSIPQKSRGR